MKKFILILSLLFSFSTFAQDLTIVHFNYKWNDKNSYDLRGIKNANVKYVWVEDQPKSIQQSIQSVPVIALLGKDGKVKGNTSIISIHGKLHITIQFISSAFHMRDIKLSISHVSLK